MGKYLKDNNELAKAISKCEHVTIDVGIGTKRWRIRTLNAQETKCLYYSDRGRKAIVDAINRGLEMKAHIVADQRRESDERSLHPRC